jgi:hypothetical protein
VVLEAQSHIVKGNWAFLCNYEPEALHYPMSGNLPRTPSATTIPCALSDLESERRATADFKPAPELFRITNPEQRG